MADSNSGHSFDLEQQPLDANQHGQAANITDETTTRYGTKRPDPDLGAAMEAPSEAVKDRVDDAIPKGPKKADQNTGGRVMVGEEGDLHDLAARRQP
ncbi:hypothetical protein OQA88_8591 [Cercophora sp. LCS_1]